MKIYLNTKTLTINNQNLLKENLLVPVELSDAISSDILVTIEKSDNLTQKTLLFVLSSFSQEFETYIKTLIKSLENEEAWIMFLCLIDTLEGGSELTLRLFEIAAQESNVMIFPVFDYNEVKDWLLNFIKSQSSEVFDSLRDIRNEILLNSMIECREEFTNHLNKTKPINAAFTEDFLENPELCLNTYFPQNLENESFYHLKEDFTFLLKKKFDPENESE